MEAVAVVFPHQLFGDNPCLKRDRIAYLVEDPWFFRNPENLIKFHQQKLVLHRASMQAYRDLMQSRGYLVRYLEFTQEMRSGYLFDRLREDGVSEIVTCQPVERGLTERLSREAGEYGVKVKFLATPMFLCSEDDIGDFFQGKAKFHQTSFYIFQRRRWDILLENGKPLGGRWTYDPLNRRKLPRGIKVPALLDLGNEPHVAAAKDYVTRKFSDHPGETSQFIYPVTHPAAQRWLDDFLLRRLGNFGDYQDAISISEPYLFHSLISPLLNIGLLTPKQVVESTLAFAREHPVHLNSLEGFVRQILGWREYVRAVYLLVGEKQRSSNFWGHTKTIPGAFYAGATGIPPLDTVISRLMATAYAHHIERLMVLGNFMLLAEIDPGAIYQWFMEMFIDAYDWVMVPNVYGMSQFADGGLIMTKPYLSASHYLMKMSDYPAGPWCEIWDGLFWRFIEKHRKYFATHPRLRPMVGQLDHMDRARFNRLVKSAETFLNDLFQQ